MMQYLERSPEHSSLVSISYSSDFLHSLFHIISCIKQPEAAAERISWTAPKRPTFREKNFCKFCMDPHKVQRWKMLLGVFLVGAFKRAAESS